MISEEERDLGASLRHPPRWTEEASGAEIYRAVFEAAPDGIVMVDASGTIREVNAEARRMFGYGEGELPGRPVEDLLPEALRELHRKHRRTYTEDPYARPMGIGLQLRGRRRNGSTFPVEISLSPLRTAGERIVIAIVRDITERQRLREFGASALRAAEEERQRIARELHDDTAQRLSALLLRLRLAGRTSDPERRRAMLEDIRRNVREAAEGVRRIARGLRPPVLADAGVVPAIRSHVRSRLEATGLDAELDTEPVDECLTEDGKLVLYRIVQEAVSNVVRHSEASRVRVGIGREGDRVVATVEDDGRGFEVERTRTEGDGLGLLGMEERAAAVGGSLSVESVPGEGTAVRAEIPCSAKDDG